MQLQCAALDQHRLKCLNAQTVQGRRTVQHHGAVFNDILQCIPNLGLALINHLLGGLDVVGNTVCHQLLHNEGPEQLYRHLLGHAALIQLQFRSNDDNGTTGVVNTLTQQVLTETALLTLEHVAQGFQRTVVGAGNGTATAAIVDQGVNRFLQHALLVADNNVRGRQLNQALQTVVPVNDPAIQIVQVRGCKPSAVQLNHGADIRRNDRQYVQHHPGGLVAGLTECLHDLQPLDNPKLLLAGSLFQLCMQGGGQFFQVQLFQQRLDGLCAHACLEVVLILLPHVTVFLLAEHLILFQGAVAGINDNIGSEVQNLLQNTGAKVQNQAHTGRNALEVPDVGYRSRQLDVAHTLTTNLASGNLYAAAVADFALVANLLVLTAVALPVLGGSKDFLAVQTIPLGLQGTIVDGFRLFYLAIGPLADHFRGSHTDLNGVKCCVAHGFTPLS